MGFAVTEKKLLLAGAPCKVVQQDRKLLDYLQFKSRGGVLQGQNAHPQGRVCFYGFLFSPQTQMCVIDLGATPLTHHMTVRKEKFLLHRRVRKKIPTQKLVPQKNSKPVMW